MTQRRVILYPFSIQSAYFQGYAWAAELAIRMKTRLQLFISFPDSGLDSKNQLYSSLLEAHGYFLQHYERSEPVAPEAFTDQVVVNGNLKDELLTYLKSRETEIVIIDKALSNLYNKDLKDIIHESRGAIILSDSLSPLESKPVTDHFYDELRHAELHKLPENFFDTLGKDKSVFNYLRRIIQRNRK